MLKNLDFKRIGNYTLSNPPKVDVKVQQMKIDPELKSRVKGYLEAKGYEVTEGAELVGKSNVTHTFDMLAQIDDGFNSYTILGLFTDIIGWFILFLGVTLWAVAFLVSNTIISYQIKERMYPVFIYSYPM